LTAAPRPPSVAIVGAGIAGLATAYFLHKARPDLELRVYERSERLGGNVITERRDGFLIDGGPDSFVRTKPDGLLLCKELGLEGEIIGTEPAAQKVYIVRDGQLVLMPGGMALSIPTRIGPMLETTLLGLPGKVRMLGDLVLPARRSRDDESIRSFMVRRFGSEATDRIAAPLLGGIYAGDIGALSIRSTFPQLLELEQRYGSLIFGAFAAQGARAGTPEHQGRLASALALARWFLRRPGPPRSLFASLRGGMAELVSALVAKLPEGCVHAGRAVQAVKPASDGRLLLALAGGESRSFDAVVLATPAHAAARVVPNELLAAPLSAIPYVSTATAFFAFRKVDVQSSLEGSGFVAPAGEARIAAGTWISSKWAGRAPEGYVLVRAFLGGVRSSLRVEDQSDEELLGLGLAELERLAGPLGKPLFSRLFRYHDANPQPLVGHSSTMARIEEGLRGLPGLYVTGSAYDGVGIPDCVRQGRAVAERLLTERGSG
jgi:oxygen-dependent protoporphyrinogen oxidase